MRKELTYTQQEIDSKINILKTDLESLEGKRKGLNQEIREKRKQIEQWKGFDLRQTRLA